MAHAIEYLRHAAKSKVRALSGSFAVERIRDASRRREGLPLTHEGRRRRVRRIVGGAIIATALLSAVALLGTLLASLGRS